MHAVANNSDLLLESDYVTLHSDTSIMKENGAKITHKLPQY